MFLTQHLESTKNLASYRTFRGPNNSLLVKLEFENRFWRKHDFAVHFEHNAVQKKWTPPRKNSYSKVPTIFWNPVFFWFLKYKGWITPEFAPQCSTSIMSFVVGRWTLTHYFYNDNSKNIQRQSSKNRPICTGLFNNGNGNIFQRRNKNPSTTGYFATTSIFVVKQKWALSF